MILIESSENGMGAGIESGYASLNRKRIIVIEAEQADLPVTLRGIADRVICIDSQEQLGEILPPACCRNSQLRMIIFGGSISKGPA